MDEDRVVFAGFKKEFLDQGGDDKPKEKPRPQHSMLDDLVEKYYDHLPTRVGILALQGVAAVNEEEPTKAEAYFTRSLYHVEELAKGDSCAECVVAVIVCLNNMGLLEDSRGHYEEGKKHLERAVAAYEDYNKISEGKDPQDIGGKLVPPEESGRKIFEAQHVLSLYYLAQVCSSLKEVNKSTRYCHETLARQLALGNCYDSPVEWALNCATLAMMFINKNSFKQARHHLAASTYMLDLHREKLDAKQCDDSQKEQHDADMEVLEHRYADLARCWVKYGLSLLEASKQYLYSIPDMCDRDPNEEPAKLLAEGRKTSKEDPELTDLYFKDLKLSVYEEQITDKLALTYDDARIVFLNMQPWIEKAKKYYSLENLASDHILITQDASQLYKFLAFFEENDERQAKMHKRRIDLLESVLKELNPTYYLDTCRSLWFELGETYSEILYIKLDKLQTNDERPSPHALKKINHLVCESIKHFESFLDSTKDLKTQRLPEQFPDELLRPALMAYFHIGRLNMKYISLDKKVQLQNIERAYQAYFNLVDYCEADEEAARVMASELSACKSMVNLLPVKIAALKADISV